ncbi:MAG: homocysteine S-methyltransferase family protein, partial [Candidatus Krumholzibacteriota bacterium]|nr:homocysteine S-methyltransferase family protein [Candidatus Krumholzibacteriota bacterium]
IREINLAAVESARRAIDQARPAESDRPRFIAGSLGPTGSTASLSKKVEDPGYRDVTFDQGGDLLTCVHDGGVVSSSETLADLRKGRRRKIPGEKNRHLTRKRQPRSPHFGLHPFDRNPVVLGNNLLDRRNADLARRALDEILEHFARHVDGNVFLVHARMDKKLHQAPLELTNVTLDGFSDELEHSDGDVDIFLLDFFAQNRQACLVVGCLDVGDETPFESRHKTLLERGNFFWWTITRYDNHRYRTRARASAQ